MLTVPAIVPEWHDVEPGTMFDEILGSREPALLRGAARHWPAVRAGLQSPGAMSNYLLGFDAGAAAELMLGEPSIGGRFFYNDDLTGLNFRRQRQPLRDCLRLILEAVSEPSPPALYVGALPMPQALPGFTRDNSLRWLDPRIVPRLWLSNRVTVQTHYDLSSNLACVVAGQRRFTLFPPEQFENLYVGPFEFTLAGPPVSMVRLDQPDEERYPRFREAWRHARTAVLGPGDVLYIPYMWWHHVESLEPFNVLVNYWWDDTPAWMGSPFEALVHALMSVRSLPPHKRDIWEKLFSHYVFEKDGEISAHLPSTRRGLQGPVDPRLAAHARAWLASALKR